MNNLIDFAKKSKKSTRKKIMRLGLVLSILFSCIVLVNLVANISNRMFFAYLSLASINLILICLIAIFILMMGFNIIREIYLLKDLSYKISLLIDLSHKFQACSTSQKIAHCIAEFLEKIFDQSQGVIYLTHPDYHYLEAIEIWGKLKAYKKKLYPDIASFAENSSRQNKSNTILQTIIIEQQLLGIIQMEYKKKNNILDEQKKKILATIAKSAALALANLKFREVLQSKSTHDPLTGLFNRNYLNEYLVTQLNLALRHKKNLAVILFDIDHFKEFNDDYGHDAGDLLLMAMGTLLQEEARMSDAICRYGGEEFIWILYDCSLEAAKQRAETLRKKIIKLSINYNNKIYRSISISLGISCFPDNGTDANELIIAADKALYRAKRTGRNKVITYSEINHL